jgi:peptidylprolyl isomerase
MPAKQGDTVKVHYTGKFDSGEVFDSSQGREPVQFTIGKGEVIPGFENAVVGMEAGDEKTIHIPSDQAYGERIEELVQDIPRDTFAEDMELKTGQGLQIRTKDGKAMLVVIKAISDDAVTLDGNHPLAGKDLNFDIKLVEILQA